MIAGYARRPARRLACGSGRRPCRGVSGGQLPASPLYRFPGVRAVGPRSHLPRLSKRKAVLG